MNFIKTIDNCEKIVYNNIKGGDLCVNQVLC